MKIQRNVLSKADLQEIEKLVHKLDVAVDNTMKNYFELVEKYLVLLRNVINNQIHDIGRDVCVKCADYFNEEVKSELGKISIGKCHCYQDWVGIGVVKDNVTALFWADWEFKGGKIEITLDKSTFKVLPGKW